MPKRRRNTSCQRRATSTLSLTTVALLCRLCGGKDILEEADSTSSSNAPNDGIVENFRSAIADTDNDTPHGYNAIHADQIEMTIKQEAMASGGIGRDIGSSIDSISRALQSSEPQRACFWRWDVSCQDDPTYRSKYNLRCDQHVKFDCLSFLGPFTQDEVFELIERCPCSCRVECNTFTWEPSSGPSAMPSISFPPTPGPTLDPTHSPTARPTAMPTFYPTFSPTEGPTPGPTKRPATPPSSAPSADPSSEPTVTASSSPSAEPTIQPSTQPTLPPSTKPSSTPTVSLSSSPSGSPTASPSSSPSASPTHAPYECDDPECQDDSTYSSHLGLNCLAHARFDCRGMHAIGYSNEDMFFLINSCPCSCNIRCNTWTRKPSGVPSMVPTTTFSPSDTHSNQPSNSPSATPSLSLQPSTAPTSKPTYGTYECDDPSCQDNLSYRSPLLLSCTDHGRFDCQNMHAIGYTADDVYELITKCPCSCSIMCGSFPLPPTDTPSMAPTISTRPSSSPTSSPFTSPSWHPSEPPTLIQSSDPSALPSAKPTQMVSTPPSVLKSSVPSALPSARPSSRPSARPSRIPSKIPSVLPSLSPSFSPSLAPSSIPSLIPSIPPSLVPSNKPSTTPSSGPSSSPSSTPSTAPSSAPSLLPSKVPSTLPSNVPSFTPSMAPSSAPSLQPSTMPSNVPSSSPSDVPTPMVSLQASNAPSGAPTNELSSPPSAVNSSPPTVDKTGAPSHDVSSSTPSHIPTNLASDFPTTFPSQGPTSRPTAYVDADFATLPPTQAPSDEPSTSSPTSMPTDKPMTSPPSSPFPTERPISVSPTLSPTMDTVVPETMKTSDSLPVYDCSDPTCQDDPNYKSPLTLGCDAHIQVDCARLGMVGFTEEEVDLLLGSCPCACGVPCDTNSHTSSGSDIIDWTFTTHGVVEGGDYGWETSNEGRTVRFVAEPSQDCGGGNGGMQTGTATAVLTFDEPRPIFYVLGGLGEQLDTSYEKMELRINGELVGRATSQAKNHECSTGPVSVKYAKNPYLVGPGTHVINLLFTTGDDFDHVGVYYELTLFVDL